MQASRPKAGPLALLRDILKYVELRFLLLKSEFSEAGIKLIVVVGLLILSFFLLILGYLIGLFTGILWLKESTGWSLLKTTGVVALGHLGGALLLLLITFLKTKNLKLFHSTVQEFQNDRVWINRLIQENHDRENQAR